MPSLIPPASWLAVALLAALPLRALEVAPAEKISVTGEALRLPAVTPKGWGKGARLKQLQLLHPGTGTTAPDALDPSSVVIHSGAEILREGRDYVLDHQWGTLGLGSASKFTPNDPLTVDYRYSLRRIDSTVKTADGRELVRQGRSRLTDPEPPALAAGETRLANLFVNYGSDGKEPESFPILETPDQARTLTTAGRIPRTLAKLKAHQPVKIVCWGDSVTVGFEASTPQRAYARVFERRLKSAFPGSPLQVEIVAASGSTSTQWIFPARSGRPPGPGSPCDWNRVARAKPDLVSIEFVNDAGVPEAFCQETYSEILRRTQALGAELILITPHFTRPEMMKFETLREPESRPYVGFLLRFAADHHLAVADASARWAHLWKEGLPYTTLLHNGLNHPDDRGHAIFADELMKCFAPE